MLMENKLNVHRLTLFYKLVERMELRFLLFVIILRYNLLVVVQFVLFILKEKTLHFSKLVKLMLNLI